MGIQHQLLLQLCDGNFHSGESLANRFGVTRTAIWKACKTLQKNYALQMDAVKGRGYRLAQPLELLNADIITAGLHDRTAIKIETQLSTDSTNRDLLERASRGELAITALFAEQQTAGRGRRGRAWLSPFGSNLYFSLLWRFTRSVADLPGLGLAIGVAMLRVLQRWNLQGLQLKWPNDLLCQGRKLGGILIEVQGETSGPCAAVIGVGLNVHMPKAIDIDQPWIDLYQAGVTISARNQLAVTLLDEILMVLHQFSNTGLASFLNEWRHYDYFRDQPVDIQLAGQVLQGIARGVDDHGALLVEQNNQLRRFFSGDISLRGR